MTKHLLLFFSLLFLFSCNTKQENKTIDTSSTSDTLVPLQVTVIANLPDSLQPKITMLDTMPKPLTVMIPITKGGNYSTYNSMGEKIKISLEPPVIKPLAMLKNEKGETIIDQEGNPYIMGFGGKSFFTNLTTDNGLVMDVVNCSVLDKTGNLWFGTALGASCYDGKNFTNFSTNDGLVNKDVGCILEDKNGNIWFGTNGGGLSCYNGKTFTNFTTAQGLANNYVCKIFEDKTGHLWFGTWGGGVSRYDGKSFTNFSTAQGLSSNIVLSIVEDEFGSLWFSTYYGLSRYDGKSFTNYTTAQGLTSNNLFWSSIKDKNGNLWFGSSTDGVSRYDWKRAKHPCNNNTCKHNMELSQDIEEHNMQLAKSFTNFTMANGLAKNDVRTITEDKTGNLWFGTWGGGVSYYDGKSFTNFSTTQGLSNNMVLSIVEDKFGSIWFGTFGDGVSRYEGKSFTNFNTSHGLAHNTISSIVEDQSGILWFCTTVGISRYDGKSFTNFTNAQGLIANNSLSVIEDKTGNLWFGTDHGVYCFNGKSFTNFSKLQGLISSLVTCIYEDKKGIIWFGTPQGLSRYDGESFTNFSTNQGLAGNYIRSICEDKTGSLWFATNGGGVSRYDGKSFINFTTDEGLANNIVFCILEDKSGNLLFATGDGLSILDAEQLKQKIAENPLFSSAEETPHPNKSYQAKNQKNISKRLFKNFKTKDGLPDNYVTNVIQMTNGKIAVGTTSGIAMFNLANEGSKLTDIEIYNSKTGYPVKDVNVGPNCLYQDSKGNLWAATGSEKTVLVRIDYASLKKNLEPPSVIIKRLKVNEENISWYDLSPTFSKERKDSLSIPANITEEVNTFGRELTTAERDKMKIRYGDIRFDSITPFYPIPQNLILPYKNNNITFDFIATETRRNFMVRYQYQLEGYSKDWSPETDKTSANFGNISAGTYTFKLKAKGPEGLWSEPHTYTFTVLPPWYRTWWAYSLYALLFIFVLVVFIKWREHKLQMEKEKLEKTVEIRTEELVQKNIVVEKQKEELVQKNIIVEKEKKRSDDLLLNILPEEVAEELKAKGSADAKHFNEVTVMFTDFKGFTQISEKLTPSELVAEIHTCFKAFDHIIDRHNIEKIKTIGDAYMCASGLPVTNTTNAIDVVNAAMEIQKFMQEHLHQRQIENKEPFEIRIGIHTGPVVAGIVGIKKFAYDIWGDTVNIASRMESSGEAGKVNISGSTYELVKEKFNCTHRGKIQAKNKGEIDMFFVEGKI